MVCQQKSFRPDKPSRERGFHSTAQAGTRTMRAMSARLSVALRPSWSVGDVMRSNVGIETRASDSQLRISREKLQKLGALSKLEIPTEQAQQRVLQLDLEKMYNLFDMLHQGACAHKTTSPDLLDLLLIVCALFAGCSENERRGSDVLAAGPESRGVVSHGADNARGYCERRQQHKGHPSQLETKASPFLCRAQSHRGISRQLCRITARTSVQSALLFVFQCRVFLQLWKRADSVRFIF